MTGKGQLIVRVLDRTLEVMEEAEALQMLREGKPGRECDAATGRLDELRDIPKDIRGISLI